MLPREPVKVRVPKVKPKGPVAAKPSGVFGTPQADKTFKPKPAPASVQRATRQANRVASKPVVKKGGLIGTITGAAKLGQAALRETVDAAGATGPLLAAAGAGAAKLGTQALGAVSPRSNDPISQIKHDTLKKIISNAPKDAAELAITTPTSLVKLGDTAIHHPERVPGMLAAPYIELAKHPGQVLTERPVSALAMMMPAVRVPGRVAGTGLRLAGKQTLERAPKTLPGTALKETRKGSRDAVVNVVQKRRDAKKPAPVVTKKDVQRRADEFHDVATQERLRIRTQTIKTLRKKYKDLPKAERDVLIANRVERASKAADVKTTKMFASEFGANARLSSGAAERNAAAGVRKQAVQRVKVARQAVSVAQAEHQAAMIEARLALGRSKRSPQLTALEQQHRRALVEVTRAKQAQQRSQVGLGVAKGRQEVLRRNIGGGMAGGRGIDVATQTLDAAAQRVRDARAVAKQTGQAVSVQRARLAGVPPVQHDALMRAMAGEQTARLELGAARGERASAKAQHIQAKQAMTNAQLVDPAQTGRLFDHKADARKVIQRLPVNPDGSPAFTMISAGKRYAVVPNVASNRLMKHRAVGTSPATMAKVMRVSRRQLTNTVLPTSIKWLSGQVGEAGLRATVAGAGPLDVLRVNKVVRHMNRAKKGSGDEFLMRITGGQFGLTGTARDFAAGKRSLADEFQNTALEGPAALASKVGGTAPARATKAGWNQYSRAVFDKVNGVVENTARKAMAGQALKDSHLMERSILGLSDKAIHDAALGLKATENQVALGRAVDRMYGKYQKFSPETRSLLLHWTPFLPWYLNSAKFLMKVLPVDHPVHAALIASTNVALEDWRKEHKLSLHGDHRPVWQMGGYPGGGGVLPVGKVTPFAAAADPLQAAADLTLPQFSGPWKNAGGVDWKWQRLKHPGYAGKEFSGVERGLRALTSGVESQVPLVSQAGRLSGVTPKYVDHKASPDSPGTVAKKLINPVYPIKSSADHTSSMGAAVKVPVVKVKTVKVKTVKVK